MKFSDQAPLCDYCAALGSTSLEQPSLIIELLNRLDPRTGDCEPIAAAYQGRFIAVCKR
jgi:hypothetical protein